MYKKACCTCKVVVLPILTKIMGAIHSTKIPTSPTGKSGPPQKVDPFFRNFSGWTEPIHWVLDRNFRKFWLNGSRPMALVSTYCFFCHSRWRCRRRPRCLSFLLFLADTFSGVYDHAGGRREVSGKADRNVRWEEKWNLPSPSHADDHILRAASRFWNGELAPMRRLTSV